PARWLGNARGFLGWSLPTRVALILALFLTLCVCGVYLIAWFGEKTAFDPFDGRFIFSWLLLLVAIPVASYFAVKAWLESEPSQYPDLDQAWEQGLTALGRAGLNIDRCPLFFATGIASPRDADNLMQAVDWELLVDGQPEGESPLRWYASRDAIVVFLLGSSATSLLQERVEQALKKSPTSPAGGGMRGTLMGPAPTASGPAGTGIRGTILADAAVSPAARPAAAPAAAAVGLRGTMLAGQSPVASSNTPQRAAQVSLDRREIADQADRLARVCRLASQARQPLCPLNGSIAIIDWQTLVGAPDGQLASVLREDAGRMLEASQLHAPMALLIKGLDDEMGFIELTRRVGENRARDNRFGHGFNHLAPLEAGQLSALGKHACGAFEDWIYDLFRHPDALGRTNNDKLYALLCKMRNEVQPKVIEAISSLSGTTVSGGQRGPLLCGCYFGAAGGSRMRQAFVRSVFDKLLELEEDLDWTDAAWNKEYSFQNIVRGMLVINAGLIVAIIALLVYYFFFSGG
ncbi:MAG: hypothetical protein KDA45_07890, partial [Planctomycetales bacterium]|nr:hypothetical protein [Planctomycetales bacterium]